MKKTPETVVELARGAGYDIAGWFVGFSGGNDSLACTHWMMEHVSGCRVFHANTGIGIERTRQFVRETCHNYGWPLVEIRAKEDCGQDYRQLVLQHGFPGPALHYKMYNRLKERCVELLLRRTKRKHTDKIVIASGIRHDESRVRMGYKGREMNRKGAQIWLNPIYWWSGQSVHDYIRDHQLKRNPISEILGMSGECLCGAFAHPGEKALVRQVSPETAEYIDKLEVEVRAAGHDWGWEEAPPKGITQMKQERKAGQQFMPFCVGCTKAGL